MSEKVEMPRPDLVSVRLDISKPHVVFDEHEPIKLMDFEWQAILKREAGPLCVRQRLLRKPIEEHDWVYRQARPVGELKVAHNDPDSAWIEEMNFPAGRFCKRCHKVEFIANEKLAEKPWQQLDLTPDG